MQGAILKVSEIYMMSCLPACAYTVCLQLCKDDSSLKTDK